MLPLTLAAGNVAHDSAPAGGAQDGTSGVPSAQWQPGGGILGGAVQLTPTSVTDLDEAFTHTSGASLVSYPFAAAAWAKTTPGSTPYAGTVFSLANQVPGKPLPHEAPDRSPEP